MHKLYRCFMKYISKAIKEDLVWKQSICLWKFRQHPIHKNRLRRYLWINSTSALPIPYTDIQMLQDSIYCPTEWDQHSGPWQLPSHLPSASSFLTIQYPPLLSPSLLAIPRSSTVLLSISQGKGMSRSNSFLTLS